MRYDTDSYQWCASSAWVMMILIMFSSITGCGNPKYGLSGPEDAEKIIYDRVSEVWKARIEGDCATIYAFACSNYRNNITKEQHMVRPCKCHLENLYVAGIELAPDGTTATATIRFDTEAQGFLVKGAQIKETWIKENGNWVVDLPVKPRSPFEP